MDVDTNATDMARRLAGIVNPKKDPRKEKASLRAVRAAIAVIFEHEGISFLEGAARAGVSRDELVSAVASRVPGFDDEKASRFLTTLNGGTQKALISFVTHKAAFLSSAVGVQAVGELLKRPVEVNAALLLRIAQDASKRSRLVGWHLFGSECALNTLLFDGLLEEHGRPRVLIETMGEEGADDYIFSAHGTQSGRNTLEKLCSELRQLEPSMCCGACALQSGR